jgi:enoyl-CoA hydratase/carnithine racemase
MTAMPVLEERDGAIATLTLNRPDRLNAVSEGLYATLLDSMTKLSADDSVRAIILTGAGRGFCVGADLKAHGETVAGMAASAAASSGAQEAPDRRRYIALAQRANRVIQRSPKPVVAAVNGHAVGAGFELAMSCDVVVISRQAKLRMPEIALGTFVGGGITRTLVRRAGLTRAKELLMLCDFFSADDAVAWNLANRAVDAAEVLPTARALAARLASHAPVSLRHVKRLLDRSQSATAVLRSEAAALQQCMATEDWREGVRAFDEKREPRFTGR